MKRYRIIGFLIFLFCGWMWYSTDSSYGNREEATKDYIAACKGLDNANNESAKVGTPQPDISASQNRQDLQRAEQSLSELRWKELFIKWFWTFGFFVGMWQIGYGKRFSNLPWKTIVIIWGIGFSLNVIQLLG